jgi:hypothetical protein
MEAGMNKVERGTRRYYVEFTACLLLLFLALWMRRALHPQSAVLNFIVATAPVLPVWLGAGAVVRLFLALDEFPRRRMLNAIAVAAMATSVFVLSWATLRGPLGLPGLPLFLAWPILGGAWFVAALVPAIRDAITDKGLKRTLWPFGVISAAGPLICFYGVAARPLGWPYPHIALIGGAVFAIVWQGLTIFVFNKRSRD